MAFNMKNGICQFKDGRCMNKIEKTHDQMTLQHTPQRKQTSQRTSRKPTETSLNSCSLRYSANLTRVKTHSQPNNKKTQCESDQNVQLTMIIIIFGHPLTQSPRGLQWFNSPSPGMSVPKVDEALLSCPKKSTKKSPGTLQFFRSKKPTMRHVSHVSRTNGRHLQTPSPAESLTLPQSSPALSRKQR